MEDRIAYLQSEIEVRPVRSNPDSSATPAAFISPDVPDTAHRRSTTGIDNNAVGELVGFLALNSEAPAYVGSSSGLPLASNLGEMVQATVWNQFLNPSRQTFVGRSTGSSLDPGSGTSTTHPSDMSSGSRERPRPGRMEELLANGTEPPNDEMGLKIINAYFTTIFHRYPFLDREELWRLHANRWLLAKFKHDEITRADRFGIFKLYLVYAIGATLIQLNEKHTNVNSEVSMGEPLFL